MKRGIIYIALILIAGAWSLKANAQAVDLSSYFNMTVGRTLVHNQFEFIGGSFTFTGNEATVVVSGGAFLAEVYVPLPAGAPTSADIWEQRVGGRHFVGEVDLLTGDIGAAVDPPGPIDGVMNVGQTVTFNFQQFDNGVPQEMIRIDETLVAANFPYTTSDGTQTFSDCVLITLDQYVDGVLDERTFWIWANNVGPVFELNTTVDGTPIDFREIMTVL